MNIINTDRLNELHTKYKDDIIDIELGGSQTNPYIQNPHDVDVILVLKNDSKLEFDVHEESVYFGFNVLTRKQNVNVLDFVWAYEFKWRKSLLFENPISANCDILENKKEYIQAIKRRVGEMLKIKTFYRLKHWYHIYTGLCIIKNNSYDLTEDQIRTINLLHDEKEDNLERKAVIDSLIEEVNSYGR